MRAIISFFIIFISLSQLMAQSQTNYTQDELLIQFHSGQKISNWVLSKSAAIKGFEKTVDDWNIFKLKIDPSKVDLQDFLENLKSDPAIKHVQYNHLLTSRSTQPNDPKYGQWQWNMELLGLPDAWEITKGGTTALGDSIVVAVIDGGCDVLHEDLMDNIWKNHQEIPNDGLDNDNNGYTDDYQGWQIIRENDIHDLNSHGTSVAGIIGAVGNNNIGISGINWNVKMMIVSAQEQDLLRESNILKAYKYILDQRKLYRESNGLKGAFVVSINLSAGVDYGQPDDFPIWCSIYDSLGAEGILSVGAVMNRDIDIDDNGDIPSLCPSPFHIAVTNTTRYDALDPNAAWGIKHVDIAAPGAVYTSRTSNTYNVFGGTSGAAPHVAGAIALLASYPDAIWAEQLKIEPSKTALDLKNLIYVGAEKIPSLKDKASSEGRLNIGQAIALLNKRETETNIPIFVESWGNDKLLLKFGVNIPGEYQYEIFDISGKLRYKNRFTSINNEGYNCIVNWDFRNKEILVLRLSDSKGKKLAVRKF
jgi:serine protease